jgi:hypothetical protein
MSAAALHLEPELGLYPPKVVEECSQRFKWDQIGPDLFVLELLDVVLKGWRETIPQVAGQDHMSTLKGDWGEFEVLKPVVQLSEAKTSPCFYSAPEPTAISAVMRWFGRVHVRTYDNVSKPLAKQITLETKLSNE